MKKGIIILVLVLFTLPLISKTITIGSSIWHTEDIAFSKLITIAKKQNKPILTVFSAAWCNPCQKMKKEVFTSEEFKKVADKFILQYVEQTTPAGMEYVKSFNISVFPTIKRFSSDGYQIADTIKGYMPGLIDKLLATDITKKHNTAADEISRYNNMKMYDKAISLSEKYLKEKKVKYSDHKFFYELIKTYLYLKKTDNALILRNKIRENVLKEKDIKISNLYVELNDKIIRAFILEKKKKLAEKISKESISDIKYSKDISIPILKYIKNSISNGFHLGQSEKILNQFLKKKNKFEGVPLNCIKAKIYNKRGEHEKTKEIFKTIVEDKDFQNIFVLGGVIETMDELKFYNEITLKALGIVVKYVKLPEVYLLYSTVYEEMKDNKNALVFLKKALTLEKDKEKTKKLEKKIAALKQKI